MSITDLNNYASEEAFFIMTKLNNFKSQTLRQIRLWAWAAAILPVTALAGIFFVWAFFDNTVFGIAMITGETLMFAVAVAWWWWAMYVLRNLVRQWDDTKDKVADVLTDIKDVKSIVNELLKKEKEDK